MNIENELYEAQLQQAAERKAIELLQDPAHLRNMVVSLTDKARALEAKVGELAEKGSKWDRYLDADGYLDVGEVADHIRVTYIPPSGRDRYMGQNHFCQMLAHDQVIVKGSNGYRIHSKYRDPLEGLAKVFSKEAPDGHIKTSVKFNTKGLNWLHDKYARSDKRVWRSTSAGELYYE